MKNTPLSWSAGAALLLFLISADIQAKPPPWVVSRPVFGDYYVGIASCSKREAVQDCRKTAENRALLNLSAEISVNVAGAFIEKIVERTGLSEQDVRMEVRSSSRARLTGHERVADWEGDGEYWVYFRLSKDAYRRLMDREREAAVAAASDMTARAIAAVDSREIVSALRYYFEALARVQDFVGENIEADIGGRPVFLFNEIYAGMQTLMASVRLKAARQKVPALAGAPLGEPLAVTATWHRDGGDGMAVAGLPLRFDYPWKTDESFRRTTTDAQGAAGIVFASVAAADNGKTVGARVDVDGLFPDQDIRGFFQALVHKLTVAETAWVLHVFQDWEAYQWHREFEEKTVRVAAAYRTPETGDVWPKAHDEMFNFIAGNGGRPAPAGAEFSPKRVVELSETADMSGALTQADILLVVVADGRFNARDNAKNPFGRDVQFVGEIRTLVFKNGKARFSDRYKGATGWNPMGETMCLDVLALHVFKRFRANYLKHLERDAAGGAN